MTVRQLLALALVIIGAVAPSASADPFVTPPVDGAVVRSFDPPATTFGPGHRGVDLEAQPGDVVRSAMAGTVSFAGRVAGVGWVTVDHGGGLDTTYGPLVRLRVRRGQTVRPSQVLGRLADDAGHLDWGARLDGEYIDPLSLLSAWEISLVHPDDEIPAVWLSALPITAGHGGLVAPVQGVLTSGFGGRVHPVTGERAVHSGVDLAAPEGAPVVAAAAGRVVTASAAGGYGNLVAVEHAGGFETRYAHLSSIAVEVGETVAAGAPIGAVGSTGTATGPHLHFEVRVSGVAQDPHRWLGG